MSSSRTTIFYSKAYYSLALFILTLVRGILFNVTIHPYDSCAKRVLQFFSLYSIVHLRRGKLLVHYGRLIRPREGIDSFYFLFEQIAYEPQTWYAMLHRSSNSKDQETGSQIWLTWMAGFAQTIVDMVWCAMLKWFGSLNLTCCVILVSELSILCPRTFNGAVSFGWPIKFDDPFCWFWESGDQVTQHDSFKVFYTLSFFFRLPDSAPTLVSVPVVTPLLILKLLIRLADC